MQEIETAYMMEEHFGKHSLAEIDNRQQPSETAEQSILTNNALLYGLNQKPKTPASSTYD